MRSVADASVIVAFLLGAGSGEERDAMLGEVLMFRRCWTSR